MPHAGEMVDLTFDTAWITGLSAADLNNIHERCEALETVLRLLGDMRNHPLQSLGISTYSQTLREEIAVRLQAIPEGLDRLRQQTGKLMFALGLPVTIRTDEDVDRLTEMAELLASVPEMPIALMRLEGGTDAFVAECLRLVETIGAFPAGMARTRWQHPLLRMAEGGATVVPPQIFHPEPYPADPASSVATWRAGTGGCAGYPAPRG